MPEQHDNHCIMNVDYRPWRIQWIHNGQMCVGRGEATRVADLSKLNWDKYCRDAATWLAGEGERIAAREEDLKQSREREHARRLREALEFYYSFVAHERLLASGYGAIDDLEREVVLVDLEDTDAETILAVDCQTFHLERLTP